MARWSTVTVLFLLLGCRPTLCSVSDSDGVLLQYVAEGEDSMLICYGTRDLIGNIRYTWHTRMIRDGRRLETTVSNCTTSLKSCRDAMYPQFMAEKLQKGRGSVLRIRKVTSYLRDRKLTCTVWSLDQAANIMYGPVQSWRLLVYRLPSSPTCISLTLEDVVQFTCHLTMVYPKPFCQLQVEKVSNMSQDHSFVLTSNSLDMHTNHMNYFVGDVNYYVAVCSIAISKNLTIGYRYKVKISFNAISNTPSITVPVSPGNKDNRTAIQTSETKETTGQSDDNPTSDHVISILAITLACALFYILMLSMYKARKSCDKRKRVTSPRNSRTYSNSFHRYESINSLGLSGQYRIQQSSPATQDPHYIPLKTLSSRQYETVHDGPSPPQCEPAPPTTMKWPPVHHDDSCCTSSEPSYKEEDSLDLSMLTLSCTEHNDEHHTTDGYISPCTPPIYDSTLLSNCNTVVESQNYVNTTTTISSQENGESLA